MKPLPVFLAAFLAAGSLGATAAAQEANYPSDTVRIVVGSSPGGAADTVSRLIADALSERLKGTFVVENMPGAGGAIAANSVRSSKPDGHTIQFIFSSFSILPSLNPEAGYDPVADFAPVSMISYAPNLLLANPSFEVSTLAAWLEKVGANPGEFAYGSGGIGYSQHLSMEMLLQASDGEAMHIPYTGSGDLLAALVSGEVPFAFDTLTTAVPYIESGALVPLAVTSAERSPILPDVPAVGEEVEGYELTAWNGIVAPAGTSPEIVAMLNEAITDYLETDEAKAFFDRLGTTVSPGSPEEFAAVIKGDHDKFAELIETADIRVE